MSHAPMMALCCLLLSLAAPSLADESRTEAISKWMKSEGCLPDHLVFQDCSHKYSPELGEEDVCIGSTKAIKRGKVIAEISSHCYLELEHVLTGKMGKAMHKVRLEEASESGFPEEALEVANVTTMGTHIVYERYLDENPSHWKQYWELLRDEYFNALTFKENFLFHITGTGVPEQVQRIRRAYHSDYKFHMDTISVAKPKTFPKKVITEDRVRKASSYVYSRPVKNVVLPLIDFVHHDKETNASLLHVEKEGDKYVWINKGPTIEPYHSISFKLGDDIRPQDLLMEKGIVSINRNGCLMMPMNVSDALPNLKKKKANYVRERYYGEPGVDFVNYDTEHEYYRFCIGGQKVAGALLDIGAIMFMNKTEFRKVEKDRLVDPEADQAWQNELLVIGPMSQKDIKRGGERKALKLERGMIVGYGCHPSLFVNSEAENIYYDKVVHVLRSLQSSFAQQASSIPGSDKSDKERVEKETDQQIKAAIAFRKLARMIAAEIPQYFNVVAGFMMETKKYSQELRDLDRAFEERVAANLAALGKSHDEL